MESQQEYVKSLKQIKEAEENARLEVEARRRAVKEELDKLEDSVESEVEKARKESERMVQMEVEEARHKANAEAQKILNDAEAKAANISTQRLDEKSAPKIIEEVILNHL